LGDGGLLLFLLWVVVCVVWSGKRDGSSGSSGRVDEDWRMEDASMVGKLKWMGWLFFVVVDDDDDDALALLVEVKEFTLGGKLLLLLLSPGPFGRSDGGEYGFCLGGNEAARSVEEYRLLSALASPAAALLPPPARRLSSSSKRRLRSGDGDPSDNRSRSSPLQRLFRFQSLLLSFPL